MNRRRVLIETSWNVKERAEGCTPENLSCINRNIVECKDFRVCVPSKQFSVLIETSWNVKEYFYQLFPPHRCINRNIVECKVVSVYLINPFG